MSKLGSRMIQSAEEALGYATGEATEGFVVHKPVDVKAIRAFSKTFINHPQLDATIIPIGDGLGIGARID